MKMYICSPLKNTECNKRGCLYYMGGECFSTRHKEFAFCDKENRPISYEERQYDSVANVFIKAFKKAVIKAMDDEIMRAFSKGDE